jgi:hypothetical protein
LDESLVGDLGLFGELSLEQGALFGGGVPAWCGQGRQEKNGARDRHRTADATPVDMRCDSVLNLDKERRLLGVPTPKKRSNVRLGCGVIVGLFVLLIVLGAIFGSSGGSSKKHHASQKATAVTSPRSKRRRHLTPKPKPKLKSKPRPTHFAFTGYGSTTAAWNSAHRHDYQFAKNAVYDPDPGLPREDGHYGDDYTAVLHQLGHVTGYYLNFRNQPISEAREQVVADELPPDAHEVWFITKGSDCALELFTSKTLGRLLGDKAMGDSQGAVSVEFSSGLADESYDPDSVNQALFELGEVEAASQAPGC